ncbi:class I glutamine amidotransferase-like protein [Stachybotrys elegans]|uniref:Class I glutamine amidotransferase-like protein n=1 Tax=Stachybotrys elegans TaxID=80388 RepID=A0A8K0SQA2_9HYPO|nr:class I glutamine amidotransferase-like protein [Stachybotrys elegans]
MTQPLDLSKPYRPIQVGVILLASTTEILDVAPIEIFNSFSEDYLKGFPEEIVPKELKAQAVKFEFHWVSAAGPSGTERLTSGVNIVPTDSFETCPPLDIVLMGAAATDYQATEAELAFIRKSYEDCSAFIAICGGFMAPMAAGLYEGKTVTAPLLFLDQLPTMAPHCTWIKKRWARDGKLWTSGTLLNGLDLMQAFAKHYWGGEGTLVDMICKGGAWPDRDIDYKDVE